MTTRQPGATSRVRPTRHPRRPSSDSSIVRCRLRRSAQRQPQPLRGRWCNVHPDAHIAVASDDDGRAWLRDLRRARGETAIDRQAQLVVVGGDDGIASRYREPGAYQRRDDDDGRAPGQQPRPRPACRRGLGRSAGDDEGRVFMARDLPAGFMVFTATVGSVVLRLGERTNGQLDRVDPGRGAGAPSRASSGACRRSATSCVDRAFTSIGCSSPTTRVPAGPARRS